MILDWYLYHFFHNIVKHVQTLLQLQRCSSMKMGKWYYKHPCQRWSFTICHRWLYYHRWNHWWKVWHMPWVFKHWLIQPCFCWSTNVFHPCSTHISMVLSSLATLQKKTRRISCHPWWQGLSRKVVPQASRHSCYQNSTNCWGFIWLYSRDIDIVTMCY